MGESMSSQTASTQHVKNSEDPREALTQYHELRDRAESADLEQKRAIFPKIVNHFYDVVTDFYEFAWGQSFHFAPRKRDESFADSIVRHQHVLADKLELSPGKRFLDIGCGVGGPLQGVARYSGATGVGVNNNAYQISRGEQHVAKAGLSGQCSFLKASFMEIPVPDGEFDAVYATEAICHAPDKASLFKEVSRVLKPGGLFGAYEWIVTDRFEPSNPKHVDNVHRIDLGNSMPTLETARDLLKALEGVGLEILESEDRAFDSDPETPWYRALEGRDLSFASAARTPLGRSITKAATGLAEWLRLAPSGTSEAAGLLNIGADSLVEGGQTGIFTPMFFFLAQKP